MAARVRAHVAQEHRYAHCVRVARFSERLAAAHAESTYNSRIAGLLHDLARLYSSSRLLEESRARGVPVDAYAEQHPIVLHAPLSAQLARDEFGIGDPAILSAISKHTLGAREMTRLDCIVYLADSLEPGRDFDGRAALAALAFKDLGRAMAETIKSSLGFLREKGLEAAPQTLEAASTFGLAAGTGVDSRKRVGGYPSRS